MFAAVLQETDAMERPMRGGRQAGLAYLSVLLAVTILGIALVAAEVVWQESMRREKEAELLFVGEQFRKAIQQYYESSPGRKTYPSSLESLLLDPRYPGTRRYLRRLYPDPMTGQSNWGVIVAPEGGIMGVHSLGTEIPKSNVAYPSAPAGLSGKIGYAQWQFVFHSQIRESSVPSINSAQ